MFSKLIKGFGGGADQRARDAQEAAEATLRKLEASAGEARAPLRGSGSWETDYERAQEMQPLPRTAPVPTPAEPPKPVARVAIHPRRIMDAGQMALFTLLSDHLEAEAPELTLHAQVAMDAFLHVDRRAAPADQEATRARIARERVALLVADETGLPVVAVEIADNREDAAARAAAKAAALDEAGIALISVNELTPPGEVWEQIVLHLDLDEGFDFMPAERAATLS